MHGRKWKIMEERSEVNLTMCGLKIVVPLQHRGDGWHLGLRG